LLFYYFGILILSWIAFSLPGRTGIYDLFFGKNCSQNSDVEIIGGKKKYLKSQTQKNTLN